jgi:hypothetical protein
MFTARPFERDWSDIAQCCPQTTQYFPYCAIKIKPFLIHSIYCTTFQYDPDGQYYCAIWILHNNIDRLGAAFNTSFCAGLRQSAVNSFGIGRDIANYYAIKKRSHVRTFHTHFQLRIFNSELQTRHQYLAMSPSACQHKTTCKPRNVFPQKVLFGSVNIFQSWPNSSGSHSGAIKTSCQLARS